MPPRPLAGATPLTLQRKRKLEREKTTPVKKRIELKKRRVVEGFRRSEWSRKHGRDAYGENDEHESDRAKVLKRKRGKAKPRVMACVVLVGLQLTSVQRTEIVLSTLNVPLQKQVPSLLL